MASGNTTRASIPYPLSTDTANISSDIQSLAQRVADIIPVWSTGSTRPSSPVNGQIWWNTNVNSTDPYGLNYYSAEISDWVAVGDDIRVLSSDPSSPFLGLIVYRTDDRSLKYYNGTSWVNIIPATSSSGYIYVVDSTAVGSNTAWKQLPSAASRVYYNSSNNLTITTGGVAMNFGTVPSITGFSKYKVDISVPVVITAAGATVLSGSLLTNGGAGTTTGGFYVVFPNTLASGIVTISFSAIYSGSATEAITFGCGVAKAGNFGTLTSWGASMVITPIAY
jgi:hypothetical protein